MQAAPKGWKDSAFLPSSNCNHCRGDHNLEISSHKLNAKNRSRMRKRSRSLMPFVNCLQIEPSSMCLGQTTIQVLFVPINDSLHWPMVALLHTHTDAFFAIHYNSLQGTHVGVAVTKLEYALRKVDLEWSSFKEIMLGQPQQKDGVSCAMFSCRFA
jgi:hypothetical protein